MEIKTLKELDLILPKLRAVLLDFDGTLFKLNVNWLKVKDHFKTYYKDHLGNGKELPHFRFYLNFQYIKEKHGADALDYFYKYLKEKELKSLQETPPTKLWLFNEGLSLMAEKMRDNILYGIVSLNFQETINNTLKMHNTRDKYTAVLGRDDVGNAKPDPEGLNLIINEYNLKRDEVLYVGDMPTDKGASDNAKVHFIYVDVLEELLKR